MILKLRINSFVIYPMSFNIKITSKRGKRIHNPGYASDGGGNGGVHDFGGQESGDWPAFAPSVNGRHSRAVKHRLKFF